MTTQRHEPKQASRTNSHPNESRPCPIGWTWECWNSCQESYPMQQRKSLHRWRIRLGSSNHERRCSPKLDDEKQSWAHESILAISATPTSAWKRIGDKIKAGEEDRLLHDFTNILEDARVNHLLSQDFAGSGKRLNATQDIFMKKHKEMWADSTPETIDAGRASIIAMMTEAISREAHFFPHIPQVCAFMDEVRVHGQCNQPTKHFNRNQER